MLLLACAVRFLHFALFEGSLLSLRYYLSDLVVLIVFGTIGFRLTRVWQMTTQYPWLYQRTSPFGWTERKGEADPA